MDIQDSWKARFESEIERAEIARDRGNEGMARVCARRAAGLVAAEYLARGGINLPGKSAYDRLKFLCEMEDISPEIRKVATHFLIRITTDHQLPVDADLIQESRWLASALLND
jgi:hypothetical protein